MVMLTAHSTVTSASARVVVMPRGQGVEAESLPLHSVLAMV